MDSVPANADGSGPTFLVERYLSPEARATLSVSVTRLAGICGTSGLGVRYLQAAQLPAEDTCFCLFQAPSLTAVSIVNDAADYPFDRITEAVLLDCSAEFSPEAA